MLGEIDQIFTRIGASDDLASGRSTFMVEMTEAANILHNATEKSLVLVDEIGRGTSTFDGLALAYAIARHLLESNRSYTLFATHYFELTRLNEEFQQLANVHLSAIEHQHSIVFLHCGQRRRSQPELRPASRRTGGRAAKRHPQREKTTARTGTEQRRTESAGRLVRPQGALKPEEAEEHPLLAALREVQPDELSPKEALERLYQLKKLV